MPLFTVEATRLVAHSLGQTVTPHTGPYTVHLSTTAPTIAGGNITEVSGNNYGPASLPISGMTAAANGSSSNNVAVVFPQANASGWGTITHVVVKDAAGALVFFDDLPAAQPIPGNVTFRIEVGQLTYTQN